MRISNHSTIQVSSQRLVLRPYKLSDFKVLRLSFAQRLPCIDKFDQPVAATKETEYAKFKERVQRYRKIAKQGNHYVFGVFDKHSGAFIGQVDFFVLNKKLRWANLGYIIQNQYRNRGFATEASKLALKIAFRKLSFHRIEAATELDNKASQKVALKAGLLKEGRRRKFLPDKGGIDMLVFGQNAIDFR